MPSFPTPSTKAAPRPVVLVKIYASQRTTSTGRCYPVGTHIRAEIRDAKDGTVLATHASSPFSTQRLRWESEKRGEDIIRRSWDVDSASQNDTSKEPLNHDR